MSHNDEYLEFAQDMAIQAGNIMKHYFELEEKGLQTKSDNSPVTLADTEINSLVIARVKENYPGHGILGEEESFNLKAKNLWVVDPLDGTQNFANKIPQFAFSMALVINGVPKVGVVFEPNLGKLLYATEGGGAYENEKKLDISNRSIPHNLNIDSWIVGGIDNSIYQDKNISSAVNNLYKRHPNIQTHDLPVAYALAAVATGDVDAMASTIKSPWDVAAGGLIAMESGAKVTDLSGKTIKDWSKDARGILAASPAVYETVSSLLLPVLKGAQ